MRLEDFDVWRYAKELAGEIYCVSKVFPKEEAYGLTSQVRRAAVSVAANIAEGFGQHHYLSKINFYYNARGSLEETKSHLLIAYDLKIISDDDNMNMQKKIANLGIRLNNSIRAAYKQISTNKRRYK